MKKKPEPEGILVATWPKKVYATEKMSCKVCDTCWRVPGEVNCMYGGPYEGYTVVGQLPEVG